MFGLDNNVLLGLVGVVVVFCLLTNKKSFKSLMKKDMLVIVGLILVLACCMAKGGRIVEGYGEGDYNIGDFGRWMDSSSDATRRKYCGADGRHCTDEHHGILDNDGQVPVFKQEHITEELIDLHRGFLSYLKDAGMGGIEHIEHNLNSRAQEILPARSGIDNLVAASGSRENAREALISGLRSIQAGGSREDARNLLRTIQQNSGASDDTIISATAALQMLQDGRSIGEVAQMLGR